MLSPYAQQSQFKKEIAELFPQGISLRQIWLIVKLCKYVRLRARNNAAFNNFFNSIMSDYATFSTVTKSRSDGSTYPGLQITHKNPLENSGNDMNNNENEGEE